MVLPKCILNSTDLNCTIKFASLAATCNPQVIYTLNTVFYYYLLVIVTVGIFGNGLGVSLLLWAKYRLRHYSMNSFLIAVCFCDFGFLLSLALQLAKVAKLNIHLFTVFCQFSVYSTNVFMFISQWSMWALSLERYLAICRPILMFHIDTCRNTVRLLALFVGLALSSELWVFFVIKTDKEGRCNSRYGHTMFDLLNLLEAAVSYVLPGIMIVGFTLGTFSKLHETSFTELDPSLIGDHDSRPKLPAGTIQCDTYAVVSRRASQRMRKRERQTAWFLMTIVIVDTILNLQNYGVRLFSTLIKPQNVYCGVSHRTLHMVSFMLYYLQYALNVFYLICPRGHYFVKRKRSHHCFSSSDMILRKRSYELYHTLKSCSSL